MAARRRIVIQPVGFEAPVARAAEELARYLPRMADVATEVLDPLGSLPAKSQATVVLGTAAHLKGLGLGRLPEESGVDDALAIIPKGGRVYLTGSNARSVLFAVYRVLEELGAVFLRPGPGGEVVPKKGRLALPKRAIREAASSRHRGICIEGYPRMEHVLDTLDWMAKKKMNCFQIQFRHGGAFWRRGYVKSPEMEAGTRAKVACRARGLTTADYLAIDERVVARMRELGMMFHKVGHGWTANVLGYPGISWRELPDRPLSAKKRSWCAEVGGKRGLFRNEPTNTEPCYSKGEVREAFAAEVVAYARQHSEVDYLQVWLSDATNNKCECSGCRKRSISDWYAMLINDASKRLKAEGLPMRVVLIAYQELLWPPEKVKFENGDLTMMYAPMGRCYRHAFTDERCDVKYRMGRPKVNEFRRLEGNRAAAAIARMWKGEGVPDNFLFDYYGWEAMWRDGLGMDVGDSMARDMRELGKLGLAGMLSCQCIRAFYPLPYMANAMGDMLWDRRLSVSGHRRKIMSAAFGKHARTVEKYFAGMVRAFRVGDSYEHRTVLEGAGAKHAARLKAIASSAKAAQRQFAGLAKKERDPVVRTSLELVALHAEQAGRIVGAYLAGLAGDKKRIARMRKEYAARVPEVLGRYHPWVDPMIAEPVMEALWEAERSIT
jgi:hypothetical protein